MLIYVFNLCYFIQFFAAFSTTSLALPVDPVTHLTETEKSTTTAASEVEIRLRRGAAENTIDEWSSVLDMAVASEEVMSAAFQDYVSCHISLFHRKFAIVWMEKMYAKNKCSR